MLPLVRCATISRQLGQGRQRSGGSPLFMINHRSSYNNYICIRTTSDEVRMRQMFHVKHGVDAPPTMRSPKKKKAKKSMLRHSYRYQRVFSR